MLCDACQRKQACIPRALAQTDSMLLQQLKTLQRCDRQLITSAPNPHPFHSKVGRYLHQLKHSIRQCTASVYHRLLVNFG